MAFPWCLSAPAAVPPVAPAPGTFGVSASVTALARVPVLAGRRRRWSTLVVCAAPDEEKITKRSPLDFPIVILLLFNLPSVHFILAACSGGIGGGYRLPNNRFRERAKSVEMLRKLWCGQVVPVGYAYALAFGCGFGLHLLFKFCHFVYLWRRYLYENDNFSPYDLL
jgi:hypothetical protein